MYFYWNIIKTSAGIIRTKNMQAVFVGTVEEIPLINPDNCKNKE